jgi:hypothetical protein
VSRKTSSSRSYNDRTLKILWGRAAGRCALPNCRIELFVNATDHDPIVLIGDIAHIHASSNRGPRASSRTSVGFRDDYDNLILLCKNCHARLDGQKNTNTVEYIRGLKSDHEAWVRESLPERGRSAVGWRVLLLQGDHPLDPRLCTDALSPDFAVGSPTILSARSGQSWAETATQMRAGLAGFTSQGDAFDQRFAIYPLAPVSACILLGYLLTSRPRVQLFQYHRDAMSWEWPRQGRKTGGLCLAGIPKRRSKFSGDVAVCFDLSARVQWSQFHRLVGKPLHTVRISAPRLGTSWLQSPAQLVELGATARVVFETLANSWPNARRWHLFFAGPAPAAVRVGQQVSPTMTPTIWLYEYASRRRPPYRHSLILGGPADG